MLEGTGSSTIQTQGDVATRSHICTCTAQTPQALIGTWGGPGGTEVPCPHPLGSLGVPTPLPAPAPPCFFSESGQVEMIHPQHHLHALRLDSFFFSIYFLFFSLFFFLQFPR